MRLDASITKGRFDKAKGRDLEWLIRSEASRYRCTPPRERTTGPTPHEQRRLEAIEQGQELGGWIPLGSRHQRTGSSGKGQDYGVVIHSRGRRFRPLPSLEVLERHVPYNPGLGLIRRIDSEAFVPRHYRGAP